MNDVELVVLFFDGHSLARAFFDQSSYLGRVGGPKPGARCPSTTLPIAAVFETALINRFRSAVSIENPPDRPFGILHLPNGAKSCPFVTVG